MTQEQRNTLVVTLGGVWLSFICGYGIITVGHSWIFAVGLLIGAIMFIPGMWEIINWKKEN